MILLIDDEAAAADGIARVLREETGHQVIIAHTVREAMDALASTVRPPDACVLDLSLGDDASALHIALVSPKIPTLLISGVAAETLPTIAGPKGWAWLAKPASPAALVTAVEALMGDGNGTGRYTIPSSLTVGADGATKAVKGRAQVVSETIVDLAVVALLAAELLYVKPQSTAVVLTCLVGALLVSGVRIVDLIALARGMPVPPSGGGGAATVLFAIMGAARSRLGGS